MQLLFRYEIRAILSVTLLKISLYRIQRLYSWKSKEINLGRREWFKMSFFVRSY